MSSKKEFRLLIDHRILEKLKERSNELEVTPTDLITEVITSYLVRLTDLEGRAIKNPEEFTPEKILEEALKLNT